MNRPLLVLLLLSSLWGGACSLETSAAPSPPSAPDSAKITIAWSEPGGGDSNQDMTLENGVLYWADNSHGAVGATDTAQGNRLWLNTQTGGTDTNPLTTAQGVWIQAAWVNNQPTKLILLDKATGGIITVVTLPSEGYHSRMFSWVKTDQALIWHASGVGLVSVDETQVDVGRPNQTLNPEVLWSGDYDTISPPLWYDRQLYFQLRKSDLRSVPKEEGDDFIIYDPLTHSIVKRLVTDYSSGNYRFPPAVYQKRIFYQDWNAVRGLDPATKEFVFGLPQNIDKGSGAGFGFYQDKLYFSNSMAGGTDPEFDKNLICRSTVDGHLVWHVPADNYSLGNRPVVKDGVLYLMTQTGFKLFNALTGALLATDTRLKSTGTEIFDNTVDDGTYLYPRGSGRIWAVKMDWKLTADGKLTR